jgi:hypothetical protein
MFRIILFLLIPVAGFSQSFIGKKKADVKTELQNQKKGIDSLSIAITDKDSALVLAQLLILFMDLISQVAASQKKSFPPDAIPVFTIC